MNVLLVDDSPTVGRAIGRMLEGLEGCSFTYCQEPRTALDTALQVNPTVVLLDLVMPDIDGLTLLGHFRGREEFSALPIVVLSSKESPEVKARAFAAGANDYLVKIPAEAELLARVEYHSRAYLEQDAVNAPLRRSQRDLQARNEVLESLAEELRIAHQDALQASRAKSAFLANMSHEIRTPMNAIIGLTNLCLEGELSTTQREFLQHVSSSADSLLRIINDILDLSKIEAGLLDFDPHPFCLRELLDQAAKTLALKAHAKNIELVCEVDPDVPDDLCTDSLRLRQVLVNLLGNAIKFTQEGEIAILVRLEDRDGEQLSLRFSVRDTGIGIPQDKLEKIFEAFTQADNSTTRLYGGTGLGLTISASLVEMMGGSLWVESVEGQGSTFSFTLRCQKAPVPASRAPARTDLRGLRILLVDDSRTNLRILSAILANHGISVVQAASGDEALAALEQARQDGTTFDLLITDAHMPEMDGFMLAETIQRHPCLKGQPLMMLSSSNLRGDLAKCRTLGIATHMTKPVSQSELLAAIAGQLGEVRPEPEPVQLDPPATRGLRMLLAEDDPVNQLVALALLEKVQAEVTVANNGREAVELGSQGPFDVILMDVQMPFMDGFEATRALRGKGIKTPIIALTAHALKGDAQLCLDAGMNDYVSKPIDETCLRHALERVLQEPPRLEATEPPVRVLIVDDSSAYRRAITQALTDQRIEIVGSAVDGRKGLEAIERLRPDVVTLDVEMPEMDGLSALRELRRRRLGTRVVLLSSLAAKVAREALDLGADRVVSKPLTDDEGLASLRETLLSRVLELGRMQQNGGLPRETGPIKVLVVDDSGFQRRQVCRYFQTRGVNAREAGTIADAVRTLEEMDGADLLMLDLFLEHEDGLQMIREMRRHPRHMHGRVVVMSTENDAEEILRCVEAGADEYLMKPFDAESLFAKLRHVFGAHHEVFGEANCA